MNIYIEHTDGKFYYIPGDFWEHAKKYPAINWDCLFDGCSSSSKRDFKVGSRVYFQSAGWTEVVERKGVCKECYWAGPTAENCPDMACTDRERRDGKAIEFRPIEQDEGVRCVRCGATTLTVTRMSRMGVLVQTDFHCSRCGRMWSIKNAIDTPKEYYTMKNDNGKSRMDLLPFDALKGVADVLTFGANKYTPNGWKDVPDAIPRYEAALLRHFTAIKTGEHNDPETGLPHIYHVACNALFLASLTGRESK